MSSERSLRTAGIAVSIAFLALAVLSSTDVLPPWIFRAVLFLLGALLWGWLLIRTYRTLQPRQRGWMLFWQYALPLSDRCRSPSGSHPKMRPAGSGSTHGSPPYWPSASSSPSSIISFIKTNRT